MTLENPKFRIELRKILEVLDNFIDGKHLRGGHWNCREMARAFKTELLEHRDPVTDAADDVSDHFMSILKEAEMFLAALKIRFAAQSAFKKEARIN